MAEKYSLGHLSARKTAEIETHLLICDGCRQLVEASDEYIAAMRKATAILQASEEIAGQHGGSESDEPRSPTL